MRHLVLSLSIAAILFVHAPEVSAQVAFVNGLTFRGDALDATRQPGANGGRLGFFSDLYYDPVREEWWALSDRGPGGGTLPYATRAQRVTLDVNSRTGRISNFRVKETIKFTDPKGLLHPFSGPNALNGLNPLGLHADAGMLGRSFDPEGLVIDPRTGHLLVADEYGPAVYEFDRKGRLLRVFETPDNLIPRVSGVVNYVAIRDACTATFVPPFCGLNGGRQDNRGFEGLAIAPDGKKLYAVLQDPLVAEPAPNNGRNGRNVRIVVFDNDRRSATYGRGIAQFAYQLELQGDVLARILAAGGTGGATDPRQGRNIGLSAIIAINDHEFLVLERDNRGLGVDNPGGVNEVGSKRVYRIDVLNATDVSALALPNDGNLAGAGIVPVAKSPVFIDIALNPSLPNGKQAEKWEGITIGPRLSNRGHVIVIGNDNDYSVTQDLATNIQFDVYVDFNGNVARCTLDQPMECQINGAGPTDVPVPAGYQLIPGVLHAYKASAADLEGYVSPDRSAHDNHDDDDHRDDDYDRDDR